jgi:NADP-dependent 3-hydroxy acid dehydrogenase YdfG
LSRHILPQMVSRQSGVIINISSLSGRNTGAGNAIYAASKHALNGFSGCLYEDVREIGIKVSTIMPGFVETDLTENLGMTSRNMIQPEDVANCVEYVLSASAHCCPTEIVLRPQLRP